MSNQNADESTLDDLSSKLISVTDASIMSGFSTAWVRRLIGRGEIKGVKIGRNWLTTEEAVREYMQQERRPGPKTD